MSTRNVILLAMGITAAHIGMVLAINYAAKCAKKAYLEPKNDCFGDENSADLGDIDPFEDASDAPNNEFVDVDYADATSDEAENGENSNENEINEYKQMVLEHTAEHPDDFESYDEDGRLADEEPISADSVNALPFITTQESVMYEYVDKTCEIIRGVYYSKDSGIQYDQNELDSDQIQGIIEYISAWNDELRANLWSELDKMSSENGGLLWIIAPFLSKIYEISVQKVVV